MIPLNRNWSLELKPDRDWFHNWQQKHANEQEEINQVSTKIPKLSNYFTLPLIKDSTNSSTLPVHASNNRFCCAYNKVLKMHR